MANKDKLTFVKSSKTKAKTTKTEIKPETTPVEQEREDTVGEPQRPEQSRTSDTDIDIMVE